MRRTELATRQSARGPRCLRCAAESALACAFAWSLMSSACSESSTGPDKGGSGTAGVGGDDGGRTTGTGASAGAGTTGSGGASGNGNSGGASGKGGGTGGVGPGGTAGSSGNGGAGTSGGGAGTSGGKAGTAGNAGAGGNAGTSGAGAAGAGGIDAGGTAGRGGGGAAGTSGAGGSAGTGIPDGGKRPVTFMTRTLSAQHFAEGADVGDINGDGAIDLVAGPNWYAGPNFDLGGTLMANPPTYSKDQYSTFFLTFVDNLNGDNYPDVIAIADAGIAVPGAGANVNAVWYENPGPANLSQPWTRRALHNAFVSNESPAYVNLLGDAKRELVFMTNRQLGYAQPGTSATATWNFTAVTGSMFGTPYVHGIGVGDIDGDGMADIVERSGWWRQVSGATWEQHTFDFGMGLPSSRPANWGGSQMYIYDIDGDGDADVVTALAAHQYGLSWFEHQGTGSATTFIPHAILPSSAATNNFSQLHAMVAADVDGDGLTDVITGKRYYAHPSNNPDPGTTDPPVIYWFELQRGAAGATFVPHLIHSDSGVGCNFVARDLTGDGKVDIFTTNKHGTFLHIQQ
jgi:hypothetical protein